ncbi:MAG: ABC transporter ATP-binding protein [Anaerolineae bacterium]|jgi:putative ABC transport system ATP-binding protein|nr:ABC transporter ATP-binding protein [Anaerolineae bacterium]
MQADDVLRVENARKELKVGEVTVQALRGITLNVRRGEFVGVIGPSGSGKSTLLGLIGGLDTPTDGRVIIDGIDITHLNERELTRIRNEKIGFVFQAFNLIPTLTALENVALPIQFAAKKQGNPHQRATELLKRLGLGDRLDHRPAQLSGGQQQRVAIARALANQPPLLLADEPTGNLDTEATEMVMNTLRQIQQETQTTIIMVTHNMEIASALDRVIMLVDGHVADDTRGTAQMASINAFREKRQTGELKAI